MEEKKDQEVVENLMNESLDAGVAVVVASTAIQAISHTTCWNITNWNLLGKRFFDFVGVEQWV